MRRLISSFLGCGWAFIANGEIRFPSGTDYNAVFVTCSTGFHLTTENNKIVCLHSGAWNISVQCEVNGNPLDYSKESDFIMFNDDMNSETYDTREHIF